MNDRIDLDIERLCACEGIHTAQSGERHHRPNWVSMVCPFCTGDAGHHLGYSKKGKSFTCFRCGKHTIGTVLATLLNRTKKEAVQYALAHYSVDPFQKSEAFKSVERPLNLDIPGTKEVPELHRAYLTSRRFDPDKLVAEWDVRFTTYHATHAWRVIAPIWNGGRYVSYVGRDVTGHDKNRYLTCMPDKEVYDNKKCIYGMQRATKDAVVVVEGVFDAWRIGGGCLATLGTGWKPEQAELIGRNYKVSYILYDPEVEAQQRARSLAETCAMIKGHKSYVITCKGSNADDPGDMNEDDANEIRKLIK
jgi:hypothetical protein